MLLGQAELLFCCGLLCHLGKEYLMALAASQLPLHPPVTLGHIMC